MKFIKNSFQEYRKLEAVNNSSMQNLRRGVNQYLFGLENSGEETDALGFGRAFHTYVLENDLFFKEFIVEKKFDKRTKQGKIDAQEFADQAGDKEIVSNKDFEHILKMNDVLFANKTFKQLFKDAVREVSCVETIDGQLCKGRFDMYIPESGIIIDLKTTMDSSKDAFIQSMYKWGYLRQSAFYCDIAKVDMFLFVCIEKKAPYNLALYEITKEDLKIGRMEYQSHLKTIKEIKANNFQKEEKKIEQLEMPEWFYYKITKEYGAQDGQSFSHTNTKSSGRICKSSTEIYNR